jgi:hypothetical protein
MFILVPEAGHIPHPAHRHSDQMVEVWLSHPEPLQYRRLIWVRGSLTRKGGQVPRDIALFAMTGAEMEPAPETEIARWFQAP